jgi:WD40 repeat protein
VLSFGKGSGIAVVPRRDEAIVSTSQGLQLVALSGGKVIRRFGSRVTSVLAVSRDGRTLATGYWDAVALWDLASGHRLAMLRGVGRYVDGIGFSRDGRLIAAGSDFGNTVIWDTRSHRRVSRFDLAGLNVSTPAFSSDGRLIAVGIYGTGAVWVTDVRTGKLLAQRVISSNGCGSTAFSPDDRYLIAPSVGGLVTWPYDRGGTIRVFKVVHRG